MQKTAKWPGTFVCLPERSRGRATLLPNLLRVMKLTVILLTVAFLNVQAIGFSQSITFSAKDVSLKNVFDVIEKQTGYMVFYNRDVLANTKPVSVSVREMPLSRFLDLVLSGKSITYIVEGKTIYLSPGKGVQVIINVPVVAEKDPAAEITGVVKNASGEPLAGVSVRVKGYLGGTSSAANGTFKVGGVPDGAVLVISGVGYEPVEIVVHRTGDSFSAFAKNKPQTKSVVVTMGNELYISITMKQAVSNLNEIIVNKGYYTESQRLSTGSVTSVDARTIEKQPVTNVLQAMQGRMVGLSIVQNNGFPGAAFAVQVRGVNSLLRNSQPLYVVDGVPFLSDAINAQAGIAVNGANGATSPLNSINPSDIERIEVLKDGDATAIYGSRGANGVILITTKKSAPGKTRLDVSVNTGISQVPRMLPVLKTPEYLALRKLGFENSKINQTVNNAPDLLLWDQQANTDFQKLLIGNTARATDANISLSGGDYRTSFLLSGTFHHETTVYYMDKSYKRGSAHFSLNHRSLDEKLGINFTAMYVSDNNTLTIEDLTSRAYQISPNFPVYNPDGSLYFSTITQNPVAAMMRTNRNKSANLNSSLTLRYTLLPGLELKVLGGFGRADMDQAQLNPKSSMDPSVPTAVSRAVFAYNYTNNYIVEPQVSFQRSIGKGVLSALVGGSWQYRKSRQPYYTLASDFTSDDFIENVASAATVSTRSGSADYKFASVLARVNYAYDNRYVLNGVFRRDGSSRFGPNNRFGNFGSIGAAWIFSDEAFMAAQKSWLSSGKLRGSYGITGSDNIGDYAYLDSYSSTTYNYNGSTGLVPSRIANANYKWEQTKKIELALELGFAKDRIRFTPAYYNNQTSNQLISYAISSQAGFSSYQANLPATVQNSGWEFTLTTTNILKKDFTWSSSFNLSMNGNKLKSFPNIEKSSYYTSYLVGRPLSGRYVYKFAGLDATTGLPSVEDLDKNGVISFGLYDIGRGDRYYYGTAYAKYFGGFSNTFRYKQLSLDIMLQFVKQTGTDLLGASLFPPGYIYNLSEDALQKYYADGPADKHHVLAAYSPTVGNYFSSDAMIVDASFIRFKNLAVAYDLPVLLAKRMHISGAKVYLQGQNLFTITSYKGYDPESQGMSLPPLRTITVGLKLSI